METVLVTGARGTVGHTLVGLAEAAGYRVIASDIVPLGVPHPVRGEVRAGDLTEPGVVARLVKGVDHVIHTAALLDAGANTSRLSRVNTDAVVSLYEASAAAGVKRFVHMSSAMLYATTQGAKNESSEVAPRGPHGLSKYAAETFLRGRTTVPWTILRAAPIYGRRGRHFASSLLAVGPVLRLVSPWVPTFHGGPCSSFVHAEDVARALLFALKTKELEGAVANVADDDPLPLGERLDVTYQTYGLRTLKAGALPSGLLAKAIGFLQSPAARDGGDAAAVAAWWAVVLRHRLSPSLRPHLDAESATLLQSDLVIDTTFLKSLGWTPRYPKFAEGFRDILKWYQAERWVPRYR